jgi:methylmalonyl-CoA mutase
MPAPRRRELAPPGERACDPLPSRRLAEPFEALRDRSDSMLQKTGSRPKVFLANLGPPSSFTTRAGFAKNLFEAGGIEAVGNEGFASMDDLGEAYRGSGAKLACLCGSDEIYARHAAAAAQALRAANCTRIYLAGRPGELAEALRQAGVEEYVFAGCDAVQVLSEALDRAAGLP